MTPLFYSIQKVSIHAALCRRSLRDWRRRSSSTYFNLSNMLLVNLQKRALFKITRSRDFFVNHVINELTGGQLLRSHCIVLSLFNEPYDRFRALFRLLLKRISYCRTNQAGNYIIEAMNEMIVTKLRAQMELIVASEVFELGTAIQFLC